MLDAPRPIGFVTKVTRVYETKVLDLVAIGPLDEAMVDAVLEFFAHGACKTTDQPWLYSIEKQISIHDGAGIAFRNGYLSVSLKHPGEIAKKILPRLALQIFLWGHYAGTMDQITIIQSRMANLPAPNPPKIALCNDSTRGLNTLIPGR